jgi:hypothetical protein
VIEYRNTQTAEITTAGEGIGRFDALSTSVEAFSTLQSLTFWLGYSKDAQGGARLPEKRLKEEANQGPRRVRGPRTFGSLI